MLPLYGSITINSISSSVCHSFMHRLRRSDTKYNRIVPMLISIKSSLHTSIQTLVFRRFELNTSLAFPVSNWYISVYITIHVDISVEFSNLLTKQGREHALHYDVICDMCYRCKRRRGTKPAEYSVRVDDPGTRPEQWNAPYYLRRAIHFRFQALRILGSAAAVIWLL